MSGNFTSDPITDRINWTGAPPLGFPVAEPRPGRFRLYPTPADVGNLSKPALSVVRDSGDPDTGGPEATYTPGDAVDVLYQGEWLARP